MEEWAGTDNQSENQHIVMKASDATLLIADFLKSHLLADVLGDGVLVY